jgi:hypothetical protein
MPENIGAEAHAQVAELGAKHVNQQPNAHFASTNTTLMELNA